MPVSGVVIKCRPDMSAVLSTQLEQPGSLEIQGATADGRLIAVVEADSIAGELEVVNRLLVTEGVLDVQLVYHNFEDTAV
jgi:nitrate reductase NapAB chaperone NapD